MPRSSWRSIDMRASSQPRRMFVYDRSGSSVDEDARPRHRGLRSVGSWGLFFVPKPRGRKAMVKVEAVVIRERIETVIDAVEEATGHVGVTVVEAVGHGRQRGITHEYRGRVFESRFLPKALLTFLVRDELADAIAATIADAARSGNDCGDGLVWTTAVEHVTHN